MSAKKNLTVAALAALLAVPAFGATNVPHALHIPSVTAHADVRDEPGAWNAIKNKLMQSNHTQRHVAGLSPDPVLVGNINGHTVADGSLDTEASVDGRIMTPNQALAVLNGTANTADNNANNADGSSDASNSSDNYNENTNSNSSNNSSSNSASNGSTQYASKSSLPQTGESNGNSKAMAMGAVALGASASLMALSMAKKHRQESELDSVSSEPTVDDGDNNGDDKSNNNDADDIDAGYHMIMSDMFDNISKDLKQM